MWWELALEFKAIFFQHFAMQNSIIQSSFGIRVGFGSATPMYTKIVIAWVPYVKWVYTLHIICTIPLHKSCFHYLHYLIESKCYVNDCDTVSFSEGQEKYLTYPVHTQYVSTCFWSEIHLIHRLNPQTGRPTKNKLKCHRY